MRKVHPNSHVKAAAVVPRPLSIPGKEEVLTVWRKSLLVNCSGFTVFDCRGDLVFRVDNYLSSTRAEIVLMDASGKPLLTVRRKRLSFNDNWQVFDGDSTLNPLFAARKQSTVLNTKCLAQIITPGNGTNSPPSSPSSRGRNVVYEVEGSYLQRCCAVYNEQRRLVAEIRRKEAVGNDVFRLVVQPEMSSAMAMAVVILLDQMFGRSSRRP